MSSHATLPDENADGYTSDQVKVLLKLATWYARLRRPKKVERYLANAMDFVENHGGMSDAGLNRVLDRYADDFRRLRRPLEAGRLADLAQRVRASFPDEFYPDGADAPWWLQENFISAAMSSSISAPSKMLARLFVSPTGVYYFPEAYYF